MDIKYSLGQLSSLMQIKFRARPAEGPLLGIEIADKGKRARELFASLSFIKAQRDTHGVSLDQRCR
jgi:hypothetical protein